MRKRRIERKTERLKCEERLKKERLKCEERLKKECLEREERLKTDGKECRNYQKEFKECLNNYEVELQKLLKNATYPKEAVGTISSTTTTISQTKTCPKGRPIIEISTQHT